MKGSYVCCKNSGHDSDYTITSHLAPTSAARAFRFKYNLFI
jgi:hypothetical protein